MTYEHAMKTYGNDKPDIRFGMEFGELNEVAQNKNFLFSMQQKLLVLQFRVGNYTRKKSML
jgi:aspartyl-tRNA synthetase